MLLFSAAVFVSAFLLFQIQPMISKAILPWFGGAPGVWSTCLLFFQTVLFAGYAWAHGLTRCMPPRVQAIIHSLLVLAAVFLLPVIPESSWKPEAGHAPGIRILAILAATIGLPYFLLSATGPLLQRWFSLAYPDRSPYRLYAVSNAGSLIALLSYPLVFEPAMNLESQATGWTVGFWVYLTLTVGCGLMVMRHTASTVGSRKSQTAKTTKSENSGAQLATARSLSCFLLAMTASSTLLAVTNTVCQDVAVIPFLWVVPLSLYLLSFILCFDSEFWYRRVSVSIVTCALITTLCCLLLWRSMDSLLLQVGLYFVLLFAVCMLCHGEVARMRPQPQNLTSYYLVLSAGGACGGLFVALAAPLLFSDFWETHLCLLASVVVALWVIADEFGWLTSHRRPPLMGIAAAVMMVVLVGMLFMDSWTQNRKTVSTTRGFYGVLKVENDDVSNSVLLKHGHITHGLQLRGPGGWKTPTTYFTRRSGVGRAISFQQSNKTSARIGIVGLGAGTLAAYGRQGDVFKYYELNEQVIELAEKYFSFVSRAPAEVQIIPGDARLSLEQEDPQDFDVLVLDAFSGDAIPTHLLTREAFEIYQKHLAPDGIIAVHTSNLYFDLRPVVDALADEFAMHSSTVVVSNIQALTDVPSEWILVSNNAEQLEEKTLREAAIAPQSRRVLWTDSFSNLFQILR